MRMVPEVEWEEMAAEKEAAHKTGTLLHHILHIPQNNERQRCNECHMLMNLMVMVMVVGEELAAAQAVVAQESSIVLHNTYNTHHSNRHR